MVLGERIKAAREALGWSQPKLSEKSGVDIGTISALEVRRSVRSKFAPALAKALGIDLEDLLRDDGNPPKLNAPPTDKQSLSVAPPAITPDQELAHALEVISQALAVEMPPDHRAELADALSAWAKYAGRNRYRATVAELLVAPTAPFQKRQSQR